MLGAYAAAVAPTPPFFERLTHDWALLTHLEVRSWALDTHRASIAWRWLGQRRVWLGFLVGAPQICFLRDQDAIVIAWDARSCVVDGHPVWQAGVGQVRMSIGAFRDEAKRFTEALLTAMQHRIDGIEAGRLRPQCAVLSAELRRGQDAFASEFASYLRRPTGPEIPWDDAEAALRAMAAKLGFDLPR